MTRPERPEGRPERTPAKKSSHHATRSVYEATQDLRLCQDLAGHASPVTTSRYAAWCVKRGEDAVGALSY
jgi:site-specific recombinase XerC